ncbi:hypothetical protein BGZ83_006180 [Gryganskiella cystojenkinii]|nr:hypothetical protein BGZ83_006180 [Gryganskiella cystojenkinii]
MSEHDNSQARQLNQQSSQNHPPLIASLPPPTDSLEPTTVSQTAAAPPLAPVPTFSILAAPPPVLRSSPSRSQVQVEPGLTMTNIEDPLTANIIHDTSSGSSLAQAMAMVAAAGAEAGAAADAASVRSSNSSVHRDSCSSSSSPSASSSSSPSSSTESNAPRMTIDVRGGPIDRSTRSHSLANNHSSTRPLVSRPSIEIPQPQSPISLHHALDSSFPSASALVKPAPPDRILPRSIESCVQDTLAKDHISSTFNGSALNGQRRIMTPTSRLAETAVGVRRARVKWETPKTVMIVTKPGDESLLKITREIALWMIASRGLTVFVDEKLKDIPKFKYPSFLKSTKLGHDYTQSLRFWTSDLCAQEAHLFDFAITLGGDGTVLFTSWLFQRIVPPILPFSAGSLGFLTPFPTVDYQQTLSTCLDHGVRVNLRMRFSCTIYRCLEHRAVDKTKKKKRKNARRNKGGSGKAATPLDESDDDSDEGKRSLPTVLTTPTETFEILNDLVLDRGPSANLSLLELFGDEEHLTTVQADGIVISTPTGSTAYSLAAGGPLTHPEIPAILISPICPHTLSFRPMLLPDSMELRICVPFDSRSTAWASFDGRGRVELKQGDHIKVTASTYPFPTICSSSQSSDWFHSLSRCLRWNERERQKGFRVVEHSRPRRTRQPSSTSLSPPGSKTSMTSADGSTPWPPAVGSGSQDTHTHGTATPTEQNPSGSIIGNQHPPQHHHHHHRHSGSHGHSHNAHGGSSSSSFGADWHPTSGNSSATSSTRARQHSLRSGVTSPSLRKSSRDGHSAEYYDHSPQDTDTIMTCWGTDSSDTDDSDDEDSDPVEEKEGAEDGDGEWEDGSSSDDDDDDDHQASRESEHVDMNGCVALDGFSSNISIATSFKGQKMENLSISTP